MTALEFSDSIVVSAAADELYAMLSDVTRTGEWSPTCKACWWDEGDGPRVGAKFTGRNVTPERTWETRSQVIAADPGHEFGWEVNGGWVRWGFTMELADDGGTHLTQHWSFMPAGQAGFQEIFGATADAEIAARTDAAHHDIPVTLATIKKLAEGT